MTRCVGPQQIKPAGSVRLFPGDNISDDGLGKPHHELPQAIILLFKRFERRFPLRFPIELTEARRRPLPTKRLLHSASSISKAPGRNSGAIELNDGQKSTAIALRQDEQSIHAIVNNSTGSLARVSKLSSFAAAQRY